MIRLVALSFESQGHHEHTKKAIAIKRSTAFILLVYQKKGLSKGFYDFQLFLRARRFISVHPIPAGTAIPSDQITSKIVMTTFLHYLSKKEKEAQPLIILNLNKIIYLLSFE